MNLNLFRKIVVKNKKYVKYLYYTKYNLNNPPSIPEVKNNEFIDHVWVKDSQNAFQFHLVLIIPTMLSIDSH